MRLPWNAQTFVWLLLLLVSGALSETTNGNAGLQTNTKEKGKGALAVSEGGSLIAGESIGEKSGGAVAVRTSEREEWAHGVPMAAAGAVAAVGATGVVGTVAAGALGVHIVKKLTRRRRRRGRRRRLVRRRVLRRRLFGGRRVLRRRLFG